ncbi:MAG: hypothetical protein EXS05_11585 [Planctomycetaceae bacterium]|nr:hypothetical protein [Planctomycetaceae bacterium]
MSARSWLDQLQRELALRRLPRQEVARLVAELSDHLVDVMESRNARGTLPAGVATKHLSPFILTEKHMSMDASVADGQSVADVLGSPAEIAESAVREFRKRGLLRRSQLAKIGTFILLPIPLLILGSVAMMLGIGALAELYEWAGFSLTELSEITFAKVMALHVTVLMAILVPAAGLAALYGRLAARTGRRWKWGLIACLILAAVTGLSTYDIKLSDIPDKSQLTVGLGIGSHVRLEQLWQFFVPAAIGLLILRRSGNPRAGGGQPIA